MAHPVRVRTATGWQDLALVGPPGPTGPAGPAGPVGSGAGDVTGPASVVADRIAVFDSTTGKLIKDGGKTIAEISGGGGGTPSDTLPAMDGSAAAGVATAYSRGDHIHPKDTTKLDATHAGTGGTAHANVIAAGAAGFMTGADKTKLDGIATGATNYVHPTGDGNLHVPATSTTNNGKVLTAGATAGALTWTTPATVTPAALTRTDDTNVTVTLGGTPSTALLQAASLTLGWTGTLSTTRGGLGANNSASSGVPLFASGTATFTGTTGTGNFARADSPAFTTTPTAPTASAGTNTTQLATTAFVNTTVNARTPKVTVATTAPGSPATNDIWVDIT